MPRVERNHEQAKSGVVITDELIAHLATEAENGYDPDDVIARRGRRERPVLGDGCSTAEA